MRIDLGCGPNKRDPHAVGVDIRDYEPVDVVTNIETGLPFPDDSVTGVDAYSILEHVSDLPGVMAELHRVCVDGAELTGKVPHWRDRNAYIDPTHERLFDEHTFYYWDSKQLTNYPSYFDAEFRVVKSRRVRRVRLWKQRPIVFTLRVVK